MPNEIMSIIEKLDALLEIERSALLNGELDELHLLADEKEQLIAKLNAAELDARSDIEPVAEKIRHNQALLNQALEGIRSVARRLAGLREAKQGFDKAEQESVK